MDYSKLVESLKKQEANRKCFDCGVVGTTYASLSFGTFVCSQCAGILRGLNFKVKPLGISIFTLNDYEILHKNGNENAKNIWLASYDPFLHEKPNPKNYNDVKNHLIRKYKEKKFFRESKGIHFINKSIEEDIKDPLEFINKCKIKNIDVGPLWTKKKTETKNDEEINNEKVKINIKTNINKNNNNQQNNVDLLGGLFGIDNNNEQNEINNNNNKIDDVNDLLGGLNFNNDNKVENLNNKLNNINNPQVFINDKKDNDFGFDFSSFNNNKNNNTNFQNNHKTEKKEEIKDENFGFDFGEEKSDNNKNIKLNENKNIIDLNFDDTKNINENKNEGTSNLLDFYFNNDNNNNKLENNNNNVDYFNMNKGESNNIGFDFGENKNNKYENKTDDNLGFDFGSHIQKPIEENKDKLCEFKNNENNDINLGLNFDFDNNNNNIPIINDSKNINSIFEDPNTEKISDMKKNQEMKRNDNFQNLTIALENQNNIDKINSGDFDFSSNNILSNNNDRNTNKVDFNFEAIMNMPK